MAKLQSRGEYFGSHFRTGLVVNSTAKGQDRTGGITNRRRRCRHEVWYRCRCNKSSNSNKRGWRAKYAGCGAHAGPTLHLSCLLSPFPLAVCLYVCLAVLLSAFLSDCRLFLPCALRLFFGELFERNVDVCAAYVLDTDARGRDWADELAAVDVTLRSQCWWLISFILLG